MSGFRSLESTQLVLELEATVKCSRCSSETPESELIEVYAWWVCGNCYDEI
jgi:DNA-directed RNA polymerase subunit RPC12/RpoP